MVVGLDVERLSHQISFMSNKAATLQLCINNKCLILQLFHMDKIPESIKEFLMNPNFTFVGIGVEDDVKKLRKEYGLDCLKVKDVKAMADPRYPRRFGRLGLKDLALEICGLRIWNLHHVCKSNWEERLLSNAQIEYACIDAFAYFKIAYKLIYD